MADGARIILRDTGPILRSPLLFRRAIATMAMALLSYGHSPVPISGVIGWRACEPFRKIRHAGVRRRHVVSVRVRPTGAWKDNHQRRPIQYEYEEDLSRVRDRRRAGRIMRSGSRVRRGRHAHAERGRWQHPRGPQLHRVQARQLQRRRQGRREREERERLLPGRRGRRVGQGRVEQKRRDLQHIRGP